MFRATIIAVTAVLVLSACGKNEAVFPTPGQPIYQAPYQQPGYGGYPSGNGYPPGNGYPTGGFYPQMPQGYPQGYTPFLPVDYYMRNHPTYGQQWPQMWNQWNNHCHQSGISPYNFNVFWFEYFPSRYTSQPMTQIYYYLDVSYYGWMTPQTQFPQQMNPQIFWQYYQGY